MLLTMPAPPVAAGAAAVGVAARRRRWASRVGPRRSTSLAKPAAATLTGSSHPQSIYGWTPTLDAFIGPRTPPNRSLAQMPTRANFSPLMRLQRRGPVGWMNRCGPACLSCSWHPTVVHGPARTLRVACDVSIWRSRLCDLLS